MNKFLSLILVAIFSTIFSVKMDAQDAKYATKNIAKNLRKDACCVKREESMQFVVKDISDALYTYHKVVTILNHEGDYNLRFSDFTDKFDKLDDASFSMYDSNGVKIKTYQLKDFEMNNYGEDLVQDGKYFTFMANPPAYPITIEMNITEKYKGLLNYPSMIVQDKNQSVENSSVQIVVPKTLGLRYKTSNLKEDCTRIEDASNTTYTWLIKDLPAKKIEHNSGPAYLYLPEI
ncbi:MAG TPA: DUF3857 domain-containing protein, partial [Arachidicoccus sp.]